MTSSTTKNIRQKIEASGNPHDLLLPNQGVIVDFLIALGYKKGDTVFLRGFYPSDSPLKEGDKGRKAEATTIDQLLDIVTQWQREGRGCYLVVNGGGHTDSKVSKCRAFFIEHDTLTKELQKTLWSVLNLPEPTIQIDTGGKSIHSYWLVEPIAVDLWKELQADLLHFTDADRSIKNPSRVMRIPGCFHLSTNGAKESTIISKSGRTYSYNELRNAIPTRSSPVQKPVNPVTGEIPLYQVLSQSDRKLIDQGAGQGERNTMAAKLARALIGTADRMITLGYRFSGEAKDLYDTYCSRCSPPLEQKEADVVWRSAQKSNPKATLSDDYIENCVKQWERKISGNQSTNDKKTTKSTKEKLLKAVDSLIDDDLSRSEIEAVIPDIAQELERSPSDVRRTYEARKRDRERQENCKEAFTKEIPTLLKAQEARLDPFKLFVGDNGYFADLILRTAQSMPTSVENLITTLIPSVGSRIGTAARIVVKPSAKYSQPCIFWSCIVAPTGRLKTPAQQVILSGLNKLEAEEFKKWKLNEQEFQEELRAFKRNSGDEPPTPPGARKRFIVQSATPETRIKLHAENPRGLLYYRDEWSAFVNARNKYRGGKGDDLEQDLSEFNGDAILKDNSGESFFLERSAISRTGNTQPEVLRGILGHQDFEDHTGEFARWLFCLVPSPVAYLDLYSDDGAGMELENALMDIYRRCGKLLDQDYLLDFEAKMIFQNYHRFLTDAEIAENHPGLQAAYPKLKSYLARLALWLHIFNSVLAGIEPVQMIDAWTMEQSCVMIDFYLAQAKILYQTSSGDKLGGDLLKVKDFVQRKETGVTPRDVKRNIYSFKNTSTEEIISIFTTLCELGFCSLDGKKYISSKKTTDTTDKTTQSLTRKEFTPPTPPPTTTDNHRQNQDFIDKSVGGVGEMSVVVSVTQTLAQQDIQPFVGGVGGFSKIDQKSEEKNPPLKNEKQTFSNPSLSIKNITQELKIGDRVVLLDDVILDEPIAWLLKGQTAKVSREVKDQKIELTSRGRTFEFPADLVKKLEYSSSRWQPSMKEKVSYCGEIVTVVGFKDKGKEYQIEHESGFMEYVKASALKPTY